MEFWDHFQTASGLPVPFYQVALLFFFTMLAMAMQVKAKRRRIIGAGALFVIAGIGLAIAAALRVWGWDADASAYRWTRFGSELLVYVAIINVASVMLFDVILAAVRLRPPAILGDLMVAAMYGVAAVTLLLHAGVNLTGVITTSAVVTAVVGFAFQDTLGNLIGGMALQMERSVTEGDWIRVGDIEGQVQEIHWRQTTIETRTFDTVIVPNSMLMKGTIVVLGRRGGRRVNHRQTLAFTVDYRYSPSKVIEVVQGALRQDPIEGVARDPAPLVLLYHFHDSLAEYSIRYWATDLWTSDISDSHVRSKVYAVLHREGIANTMPAHAVFLTSDTPARRERKRVVREERHYIILRGLEMLAPLSDAEVRRLVPMIRHALYQRGEIVTRQGDEANWLYIVASGRVEVFIRSGSDQPALPNARGTRKINELGVGDFFGELSLLTGVKRSATVIAMGETECLLLDRGAFMGIIESRPEIAEAISAIVAERRAAREAAIEGLNEEAARAMAKSMRSDLLAAIRRFFAKPG